MRVLTILFKDLPLVQVKGGPIKPRSTNPQGLRREFKKAILEKEGGSTPNFSKGLAISLKSPIRSQVEFNVFGKFIKNNESCFLFYLLHASSTMKAYLE